MATNMLHLCMSRLRDLKTADSHAMPFKLVFCTISECGGFGIDMHVPTILMAQRISMPISRGGPLIFDE